MVAEDRRNDRAIDVMLSAQEGMAGHPPGLLGQQLPAFPICALVGPEGQALTRTFRHA